MSETLTVYIEDQILEELQSNEQSLFLAKMVDGKFTVVWQSFLPSGSEGAYGPINAFSIATATFGVYYTQQLPGGGLAPVVSGNPVDMSAGEVVTLDRAGEFGVPTGSGGVQGSLIINNKRANFPHACVNDSSGNTIFVAEEGMNKGETKMTPKEVYQVWFGQFQETGTMIYSSLGSVGNIDLTGGINGAITYTNEQAWQEGAPATLEADILA